MSILELKNVKKEFNRDTSAKIIAIKNVSFSMRESENFLSVLAPFGSGKTTLLKIIAGLESVTEGGVYLFGKNYQPSDSRIILIPEKPSSLPWLSVRENILQVDRQADSEKIIGMVGLTGYEDHFADDNSWGFRLRISLGRALVKNPALILLDDCLKNIDPVTKSELILLLKEISLLTGVKFLFASTDISSAVRLSDRIIVLSSRPAEVAGEFMVSGKDTGEILKLVNSLEKIFQKENLSETINFTI